VTVKLSVPPDAGRTGRPERHVLDPARLGDHLDRLYRAALALCGDRADAEDLVQEVCVRMLAKPRLVHGHDDAYLLTALRNAFRSQYQTSLRRRTTPVDPESFAEIPDRGRHDPEQGLFAGELSRAIAALPAGYRDAVVAVDVLGLSYAEAARALGVATGTIMSRLYRGRAKVVASVGGNS
jgi:RNA polymerase sigma-70 factor (ECF subfamily)